MKTLVMFLSLLQIGLISGWDNVHSSEDEVSPVVEAENEKQEKGQETENLKKQIAQLTDEIKELRKQQDKAKESSRKKKEKDSKIHELVKEVKKLKKKDQISLRKKLRIGEVDAMELPYSMEDLYAQNQMQMQKLRNEVMVAMAMQQENNDFQMRLFRSMVQSQMSQMQNYMEMTQLFQFPFHREPTLRERNYFAEGFTPSVELPRAPSTVDTNRDNVLRPDLRGERKWNFSPDRPRTLAI